ncbi:DUF4031 domain-containing protein [Nesterenkonia alkaliphila]|uniref:DUF4031 domain-containing protein n=1 Tax=Nesterenkonia alkaliphila TaxID=1463631 RepID=A0A7K1UIH9_9MICC|nr:DUF4031 domain-containing protein [Nesterenkonia alkaliphila]MVT26278.1 DUF4031 domain-containing protein [Nesterenkonia alkaliphila]GFZ97228.1 hypothetical protein GCM10011359_28220 [Nesterenkonia alkaliphila]
MTVYIDPPVWPAHGTVFSHLVSDASLAELHALAEQAGISRRAFDQDHYDVPAHRYEDLLDLGAVPVSGRRLARILADSGLRVRARERPEKLRHRLLRRWMRLAGPGEGAAGRAWTEVGEELLQRWSEPHRHYHALPHLAAVLSVTGTLERAGELPAELRRPVLLAGWFHDAVYRGAAGQDEEDSAQLAEQKLDRLLPEPEVAETARLVRLTAGHSPDTGDAAGCVLTDADLEVLGRDPADYRRYAEQVRADYAHVPQEQFAAGRAQVLRGLLAAPRLYRTDTGHRLWEERARQNIQQEHAELERGDRGVPA